MSFSNLGPYLETLGIPSFVIPLIKGMSQVVTFSTPDEPGGEWVMGTETGKELFSLQNVTAFFPYFRTCRFRVKSGEVQIRRGGGGTLWQVSNLTINKKKLRFQ